MSLKHFLEESLKFLGFYSQFLEKVLKKLLVLAGKYERLNSIFKTLT